MPIKINISKCSTGNRIKTRKLPHQAVSLWYTPERRQAKNDGIAGLQPLPRFSVPLLLGPLFAGCVGELPSIDFRSSCGAPVSWRISDLYVSRSSALDVISILMSAATTKRSGEIQWVIFAIGRQIN